MIAQKIIRGTLQDLAERLVFTPLAKWKGFFTGDLIVHGGFNLDLRNPNDKTDFRRLITNLEELAFYVHDDLPIYENPKYPPRETPDPPIMKRFVMPGGETRIRVCGYSWSYDYSTDICGTEPSISYITTRFFEPALVKSIKRRFKGHNECRGYWLGTERILKKN